MVSPVGKLIQKVQPGAFQEHKVKVNWREISYRIQGGIVYEPMGWLDYDKHTKRVWCMHVLGCVPDGYTKGSCFPFKRNG